jgi:predicted amidohydrolase
MPLPSDPADLFVQLISSLDEVDFNGFEVFSWMEQERVADIAEYIEGAALSPEGLSAERVEELLDVADSDDFAPQAFATLMGLDRALIYANPYFGSFDQAGLTEIAVRYAMTGALNSDRSSGTLLPRCAFPARRQEIPNSLGDAFAGVVWVPEADWRLTDHYRVPTRNDLTRSERQGDLEVVCVPAVSDSDDFEWSTHERGASRFFRISLRDHAMSKERIARTLADLDEVGATIAILPELVLNLKVLRLWEEVLLEQPPTESSSLKWLLVGTGDLETGARPVNRCVLLDRVTGEVVLTQDKVFPFVLTSEQLEEWNLGDLLGAEAAEEDIESGGRVTVVESRLGRLAVLICEDLARIVDLAPMLRRHGISHVFSPIFSKETKVHHWEHVKAKEYATEVGSAVVVSNSLVVARRMGDRGPWGTAMLHSPLTTQLRTSFESTDLARFTLVAGEPVPRTGDPPFAREDGPEP